MKLLKILLEQEKILVPRRIEDRPEKHIKAIQQKIQQYIKDGSKGSLDLYGAPITSLPNNLKYVGGNLNLASTPIKSLPDNLEVKDRLWLHRSSIKDLPDNLKVGESVTLSNTEISTLPNNLEVGRDLWIVMTPLADKYSDEEIKNLANIKGEIFRKI